jgi:hypothetical protein
MSVMAAQAGKDIWCEKPMTRTIGEGRRVQEAVKANGRIFRLNTWFRFMSGFYGFGTEVKPLKKLMENRVLGWPVKAVVGSVHRLFPQVRLERAGQPQARAGALDLDYDLWLGPAPYTSRITRTALRHLPRLLGLRRRRSRRHGPALSGPGPVSDGKG